MGYKDNGKEKGNYYMIIGYSPPTTSRRASSEQRFYTFGCIIYFLCRQATLREGGNSQGRPMTIFFHKSCGIISYSLPELSSDHHRAKVLHVQGGASGSARGQAADDALTAMPHDHQGSGLDCRQP